MESITIILAQQHDSVFPRNPLFYSVLPYRNKFINHLFISTWIYQAHNICHHHECLFCLRYLKVIFNYPFTCYLSFPTKIGWLLESNMTRMKYIRDQRVVFLDCLFFPLFCLAHKIVQSKIFRNLFFVKTA